MKQITLMNFTIGDVNAKSHKYFERIQLGNNKYRYFYSRGEYESYLKNKRSGEISRQKENEHTTWTDRERAGIIGAAVIGGSKAAKKVANDLIERRQLKYEDQRLEIMRSRANDYIKRGAENHDYSLIDRGRKTQQQVGVIQKNVNERRRKYEKTLVGKLDKAISTIKSVPEKAKKIVSSASKTVVKAIADNPVTKLGKSILGGLFGKKDTKKEESNQQSKTAEKDLTVNGIKIKIRR